MPLWLAAAIDLPVPIAILGIADLFMYLELAGLDVAAGLGWRLALVAVIALISAIGGRIIPSFTRNWLVKRGSRAVPAAPGFIDRAALATLLT